MCRGRVTGEDWRNPALWERYAGHFSPYLERRIKALRRRRLPPQARACAPSAPRPPETPHERALNFSHIKGRSDADGQHLCCA